MPGTMSVDGHQTSVFTFQSAVHCCHVLRSLDEQRKEDVLCDVTIVVENRSFRAHCSVLASCCDYFHSRFLNNASQNLVLTLPHQVTVEGFEPLLDFTYTAKLLFTEDNVVAVRRCAQFLGFHNLDQACFQFLSPKLSSHDAAVQLDRKDGSSEVPPGENATSGCGSRQLENWDTGSAAPQPTPPPVLEKNLSLDFSPPCPASPPFPAAPGQEQLCLQSCGPELQPSSTATGSGGLCPFLSMPSPGEEPANLNISEGVALEMVDECQIRDKVEVCPLSDQDPLPGDLSLADQATECSTLCPLRTSATPETPDKGALIFESSENTPSTLTPMETSRGRSSVEREVAEHLAKGFWPDLCTSLSEPQDPEDPPSSESVGTVDFHWLKHLDLSAATSECPFLRDLGSDETPAVEDCSSAAQSEKSPCPSPINSADYSNSDTEEDASATQERAREVALPFPVKQISTMSRSAFQQILRQQQLTQEQLEFVHDVRRRSKNRVAAQRCRKRKLDCIHKLECDIKKLRGQKDKLHQEQLQLKVSLDATLQSLFSLCQSVCSEGSPPAEQLLAQYLSPDRPSSVLLTPMSSPSLTSQDTLTSKQQVVGEAVPPCLKPDLVGPETPSSTA
ncbi:transcription regulator protein BACH1a [Denticeps clupeoides]|uniref:Uncharacterized protein n=1 Tax=Denticeps clupeoides TaxID=299321 RepID=A0AAY4AX15_9TELE|nr:transcription regulator protein BACH2-like [Denticeps clupeoides]